MGALSQRIALPWVSPLRARFFGSQLRLNVLAGSAQSVGSIALAAVSYPTYLYFLGYERYGLWLALSFVLTFPQFANVGITPAVMKLVAEEHGRGDTGAIRGYVSTALATLALTGAMIVCIVLLARGHLVSGMRLAPAYAAQASALIPFMSLLSVYVLQIDAMNAVLAGLGRMDLASLLQFSGRALTVLIAVALLASGLGVGALLIGSFAGYLWMHLATTVSIRRLMGTNCFGLRAVDPRRLRGPLGFGAGTAMVPTIVTNIITAAKSSVISAPVLRSALNISA